jgi:hypothetical protein
VADESVFTVAGQEFEVTNPDRVFYPRLARPSSMSSGTTPKSRRS